MNETEGMNAKQKLGYYTQKFYDDAMAAHDKGEFVCWSSSIAPSEFFRTMGIHIVYPENHAAAVGAKHGALEILELAERKGYTMDNCSYSRINLAYMDLLVEEKVTGKTPEALAKLDELKIPRIPLPDIIIMCNNICEVLLKWYENLAVTLKVPYVVIDVPYVYEWPIPQRAIDYVEAQFKRAIKQIEDLCGKPFDYENFIKVQEQTQRSIAAWDKAMGMASVVPSPLNGFDIFNFMALIVCARSDYASEGTFTTLADELQAKADAGIDAFKGGEKTRIAWEGIAVWPYLGHTFKSLKAQNTIMIGSTYTDLWALEYDPDDETLYSMAEMYAKEYINTNLENRAKAIYDIVNNQQCDGVIYHTNRSCKNLALTNSPEVCEIVKEKTGKPFTFFDGDQTDPRNFSPAQYDTRIQALVEMMEQQNAEKAE
mgnify:CR=1 FL=1